MQANTTFWARNTGIFLTYFTSALCGKLSHITDPIKSDVIGQVRNMPPAILFANFRRFQ